MIRLCVPGTLEYRDVAMRVVTAASKLVPISATKEGFDAQVVSAVGEAFNNIALHGYGEDLHGQIELEIDIAPDRFVVRMLDHGRSFDPDTVPAPDLAELPERGMGLFIIQSFMDDVEYRPGHPNVLSLTKRLSCEAAVEATTDPKRRNHDGRRQRALPGPASGRDGFAGATRPRRRTGTDGRAATAAQVTGKTIKMVRSR